MSEPAHRFGAHSRLAHVVLEGDTLARAGALQTAERARAVADLEADNRFQPLRLPDRPCAHGPYRLHLAIQEGRLVFDIRCIDGTPLHSVVLALGPFRGVIRDYAMLVDSHASAVGEGGAARIEAVDMGRRGLHNEGARLLEARLAGKVAIDFPTARRLFSLVCALHHRL